MAEELLTPEEYAKQAKLHVRTVYTWRRAGKLKSQKVGRHWRIPASELERSIDGVKKPAPSPPPPAEEPRSLTPAEACFLREASPVRTIPLYDAVSAGPGAIADSEQATGTTEVSAELRGDLFAVRVKGDSMTDAGIHDGDTVVCRRLEGSPKHGSIVVAWNGDGLVVKRYLSRPKPRRLHSENAAHPMPDVEIQEGHSVFGVVLGVTRLVK
jgi:repressor LexA